MVRLLTLNGGNQVAINASLYSSTNFQSTNIIAQLNLDNSRAKYQYINNSSGIVQVVNLPNPALVPLKEFTIINIGDTAIEIKENGVALNLYIDPSGIIDCHCDGTNWNIIVKD